LLVADGLGALALVGEASGIARGVALGLAILLLGAAVRSRPGAVALVCGLCLTLAAAVSTSPWFLPLLGSAAIATPASLVGGRSGWRLGLLALGLAAPVFLLLPRWGAAPAVESVGATLTGFSPVARIGDLTALVDDPSPVLRVRAPGGAALRLRGAVLDRFDGAAWTRGQARDPFRAAQTAGVMLEVEELRVVENVLFSQGRPVRVDGAAGDLRVDADGGLWWARPDRPLSYAVWSVPDVVPPEARHLALPPLDSRVPALAARIGGDLEGIALAAALRDHLAAHYGYTPRAAASEDGGVAPPSRPRRLLDAWEQRWEALVSFDASGQRALAVSLGRRVQGSAEGQVPWAGWLTVVSAAAAIVWLGGWLLQRGVSRWTRRQPRPEGRVAAEHARAWRALRRKGWQPPAALPPLDAARWLAGQLGRPRTVAEDLAWVLYAVRYGGRADEVLAGRARELARQVAELPGPRDAA
jgi:hypothetical protein